MRRILLCGALICAGVLSQPPEASAQFYQQRPIPQAPVPTVNYFSTRGNAVGRAPALPATSPVMQDPLRGVGAPQLLSPPTQIEPPAFAQRGGGGNRGGGGQDAGQSHNGGHQGNGSHGNGNQGNHGNHAHWHSHPRFRNDFGWGWWSVGSPWGWGVSYVPWYGLYGPASFRTFGVNVIDPVMTQPVVNNLVPNPVPPAMAPGPAPEPTKGKIRTSNAEQKARAGKFLGYGDTNFARQKYLAAIDRYKTAIEVAPDLPDSYLRQGVGLVALGQYANATKAFRRGLKLAPAWNGIPFQLDQLYGQAPLAKAEHLERLAKSVEANPLDAEPVIALGIMLLLDGHADRANVFFTRAVQLGGNEDGALSVLLPQADPGGAQPGGKIKF